MAEAWHPHAQGSVPSWMTSRYDAGTACCLACIDNFIVIMTPCAGMMITCINAAYPNAALRRRHMSCNSKSKVSGMDTA